MSPDRCRLDRDPLSLSLYLIDLLDRLRQYAEQTQLRATQLLEAHAANIGLEPWLDEARGLGARA